jgi:type III secretory pathway component EscR
MRATLGIHVCFSFLILVIVVSLVWFGLGVKFYPTKCSRKAIAVILVTNAFLKGHHNIPSYLGGEG